MLTIETIQKKHKQGIIVLLEHLNQADNLAYSLTDEWLDYIIQEASDSIFIAIYRQQLVGIATCMINEMDNTHAVINVAVHPHYRNQGIGTQLYNQIMAYVRYKNIKNIEAYVKKRLEDSVEFAKKRGFQPTLYAWQMDLDINQVKVDLIDQENPTLTFRKATIKDSQTYAFIISQTFGDMLDDSVLGQLLQDPSVKVYMLEKEGQIMGTTTIQLKASLSVGYIYDVAILQLYRGQGLGSYMLKRCIEELRADNISTVSLTVTGQNKQALALYYRLGFEEADIDIIGTVLF